MTTTGILRIDVTLCLTAAEVREVTGYTWHARQCEALAAMGVPFKVQPASGRPLVDRRAWQGYRERPERAAPEPNWKAVKAA